MADPTRRDFLGGAFGAVVSGAIPVQAEAQDAQPGRHRVSDSGNNRVHLDVEITGSDPGPDSPTTHKIEKDITDNLKGRGIDVASSHAGRDVWVRNKTAETGAQRRDLGTLDYTDDDEINFQARRGLTNTFNKKPITDAERSNTAQKEGYDAEKRRVISLSIDPKGRDPKEVMQDVDTAYRDMTGQTAPGYTAPQPGPRR